MVEAERSNALLLHHYVRRFTRVCTDIGSLFYTLHSSRFPSKGALHFWGGVGILSHRPICPVCWYDLKSPLAAVTFALDCVLTGRGLLLSCAVEVIFQHMCEGAALNPDSDPEGAV